MSLYFCLSIGTDTGGSTVLASERNLWGKILNRIVPMWPSAFFVAPDSTCEYTAETERQETSLLAAPVRDVRVSDTQTDHQRHYGQIDDSQQRVNRRWALNAQRKQHGVRQAQSTGEKVGEMS